jgi:hypothetical protein
MPGDDLPPLIKSLLYAQDHRLVDDEVGRALVRSINYEVADSFVTGILTDRVRKHKISQAFVGPFRLPKLDRGEILLGKDVRGRWIRVPLQFFNSHCLTLGGSGCGKTIRALWLTLQIAVLVAGCWLFDWRKVEFAKIRPRLKRCGVDLAIVQGHHARLNPLQVPRFVTPVDWAARAAQLLVHVLQLPERAAKLLHTGVLELYRQRGVFSGSVDYPTIFDLRQHVLSIKDANYQARSAFLDTLDPVLRSLGPNVLGNRIGWSTRDLAQRRIAWALGGLAETDKNLILNTLVMQEFTSRVAQGLSNVHMNLFVCVDEAGRLLARSNHASNIADLLGLVRGTGIGLDASLQSADIAPAVLSNTANKWIGRCTSSLDLELIASSMGLNAEQRQWIMTHLQPGWFVVQAADEWRFPAICRIPHLRFNSSLSQESGEHCLDSMLLPATSAQGEVDDEGWPDSGVDAPPDLADLPVVPATEFARWPETTVIRIEHRVHEPSLTLSAVELRFLKVIVEHPGEPSSAYPKLVGISPRKAREIRQRLCDLGFLRQQQVNLSARGRSSIILEPLEAGLALVLADSATAVNLSNSSSSVLAGVGSGSGESS